MAWGRGTKRKRARFCTSSLLPGWFCVKPEQLGRILIKFKWGKKCRYRYIDMCVCSMEYICVDICRDYINICNIYIHMCIYTYVYTHIHTYIFLNYSIKGVDRAPH